MRLAAALAVVATLAVPAAEAKQARVVTLIWDGPNTRLAWSDPATLRTGAGPRARLGAHTGSWSFSPARTKLAIGNWQRGTVRIVETGRMRVLGDLQLGPSPSNVTWLRPDRLLATVHGKDGAQVVVADPVAFRVLRRVPLERPDVGGRRVPGGLVLLLGYEDRFGAATLAVVDAEGSYRTITTERISIGSVRRTDTEFESRTPGFTVDAAGERAFLVGADFAIAEVDLRSRAVSYHGGERSLAKAGWGSSRGARWLGNGSLLVSGEDYRGTEPPKTYGLRLVDARTWTTKIVDAENRAAVVGPGVVLSSRLTGAKQELIAYDFAGSRRYSLTIDGSYWLQAHPRSRYGYVCRNNGLMRILDLRTGKTLRAFTGNTVPTCARPLFGPSSQH